MSKKTKLTRADGLYIESQGKKKTVAELAQELDADEKAVQEYVVKLKATQKGVKAAGFVERDDGIVVMTQQASQKADEAKGNSPMTDPEKKNAKARRSGKNLKRAGIHIINPDKPIH